MKILHVITTLSTGGAEHLMVDLLPRLKKMGNEVDLAVFNTNATPFYKELISSNIRVFIFSGPGNVYNPCHIFRLSKIINNYDIVHTHNTAPQLFAAICSVFCKPKLVTTEHNTSNRRRGNILLRVVDKWMYSRYDKVICISEQAEENLREHLSSKSNKICTIYNGVDILKYKGAIPDNKLLRQFKDMVTIAMVAGFRDQKDQPTLIKALSILPPKFHLLIVGDGPRRGEFYDLVESLKLNKRVHFLGVRSDVPQILKSVDIVAMSSHYEGLSLSNIEGMASGKPFIASDVDGIREITKGYGILFPEGDEKTLAKEIMMLTDNDDYRKRITLACMERASQFDIEKMVTNYNNIYNTVISS